jgi:hypothetical protein
VAVLQADAGQWLSQSEAALRLGWKLNRVISARRAGRLQARKGNRGEWLVLVPAGLEAEPEPGPDPAEAELVAELREEMAELKHALGRAEGRAETMLQQVSGLAENLAAERARADRLEAALAEARRPWLAKVLEGLRRKGG